MLDTPTLSRDEEEELTAKFQKLQEQIEHQQKIFDDLEFQQLEVYKKESVELRTHYNVYVEKFRKICFPMN